MIRDLAEGRSRFCELERSLEGISPRTLSLRLRALEEEGIVERHTFPEVPPRVEYSLTDKGRALLPLIEDMRSYGKEWLGAAARPRPPPSPSRPDAAAAARTTGGPGRGTSRTPGRRSRWRPNARSASVSTRGGSAGISRCSRSARPNARAWRALNSAWRRSASSRVRSPASTARISRPAAMPK